MDKLIPKFARVPLLICAAAQFLAYYLPRALPRLPYTIDMATPLDRLVTVAPAWIIVYVAAYFYWVAGYVVVARVSPESCREFCRADYMMKIACALLFILLPTHLPRVEIEGGGALSWMLRTIYALDEPNNLFPSMHCSVSWFVARSMGRMDAPRPWVKTLSYLFAILVFVSTLFTGQHVALDIAGGVLVAEAALQVSRRLTNRKKEHEAQV